MTNPYFSFNSLISGSLIRELIGARTPLSEIVPSRTCLVANWRGTLVILELFWDYKSGILAYCAGDADQLGHCWIASRSSGSTVFAESRSSGLLATILVLDLKLVLQDLKPRGQNHSLPRNGWPLRLYLPPDHALPPGNTSFPREWRTEYPGGFLLG